jgi:hypothetical protein
MVIVVIDMLWKEYWADASVLDIDTVGIVSHRFILSHANVKGF